MTEGDAAGRSRAFRPNGRWVAPVDEPGTMRLFLRFSLVIFVSLPALTAIVERRTAAADTVATRRLAWTTSKVVGNPEPPHMLVVGFDEPGLAFFDTQDEHDTWLASILNEPSPVIPRARKTNRPKR